MIFQAARLDQRLKLDEHRQEGKGSDGEQMSEDSDDEGEGKDKNEDEQKENKVKSIQWRAKVFSYFTRFSHN